MADDHKPGKMNIEEQERTFERFITWSIRIAVISIAIVVGLALFAT